MIERIVVPLDGSLTAEAILPQVRRVLYRNDSEVILVRAVSPPMMENGVMLAEAELGAAREYMMGQVERLEKAGVRVRHLVRVGSPAQVILEVAKEHQATLVAMSTHGCSGVKRLLFGSVAEAVLRRSEVPVLLVRPFWSYELVPAVRPDRAPVRNVLLPVDGSDLSLESLPGVIELADLFEARILLLRVLGPKARRTSGVDEKAEAEKQLKAIARTVEKRGVETLSLIQTGEPVEEILKAAAHHAVDLIALSTHGRSGLSRAVMGSVTEQILRQAAVPVLVTRNTGVARKARTAPRVKIVK